ncbi:MAG: GNAT family N-acetyltransferase [bacterium]|nr:GNAT family N-acetyltransferase [bacterium]
MAGPEPSVGIRLAQAGDLPVIYDLARRALVYDTFSSELLAEKLFADDVVGRQVSRVYLAESGGALVGLMQTVLRQAEAKAWLGLFAVDAAHRRRGIASALLQRVRDDWNGCRVHPVEVLAIPGNYFNPGLDPRYTEALCVLERSGFERFKDCANLSADLSAKFDTSDETKRLAAMGIETRRARADDDELLDAFFAEQFGSEWRHEAELSMANDPPALHLALEGGRIIAFSAHSTQNREWGFFGPMGTTPEARGKGLGRVLLWHCLNDLREAGHRTAVIPWVGPIAFYAQWADCRVERVFWRFRPKEAGGAAQSAGQQQNT